MRVRLKLLREFLKYSLLIEKATTASEAAAAKLALTFINKGDEQVACLYSPKEIIHEINQILNQYETDEEKTEAVKEQISEIMERHFKGMAVFAKNVRGNCNDSYEIMRSAGEKGFGPLLYAIAAASVPSHTLSSDRSSVSDAAANIWQKMSARGDVETLPFDDEENPQTETPVDDCHVFNDPKKSFLDNAYKINSTVNVNELTTASDEFLSELGFSLNNISSEELEHYLEQAARGYFTTKYSQGQQAQSGL